VIKILALLPGPDDGTSWYRGAGPLNALRDKAQTDIAPFNIEYSWSMLGQYDIIFMQRPFDNIHVNTALTVLQMGIKLWVDYDDLLFEIPRDNPAFDMFMNEKSHKNMAFFINNADALTFSTPHLKREMLKRKLVDKPGQIVQVIPNAFDDRRLEIKDFNSHNNIVWRGSYTHQNDILQYKDDIINALKQNDTPIHFIGWEPWFLTGKVKAVHHKWTGNVMNYMQHLRTGNKGEGYGQTFIVPLHDNNFNKAKSNINWMEATMAGACCIAPLWEEWKDCLHYDKDVSLEEQMIATIKNETRRRKAYEQSKEKIMDTLLLSVINKMRLEIFDKLLM
jgi:translation elongation factor EF-G